MLKRIKRRHFRSAYCNLKEFLKQPKTHIKAWSSILGNIGSLANPYLGINRSRRRLSRLRWVPFRFSLEKKTRKCISHQICLSPSPHRRRWRSVVWMSFRLSFSAACMRADNLDVVGIRARKSLVSEKLQLAAVRYLTFPCSVAIGKSLQFWWALLKDRNDARGREWMPSQSSVYVWIFDFTRLFS